MPSRPLDAEIDRLYQLPLDEFTEARNALAKEAGKDGAEVKRLQKPPVAAWAINQVYWKSRATYHALDAASAALRNAHAAVASGKHTDLRAAGKAHEDAFDATLKTALALLKDAGQPATEATKQAIATTLRALPSSGDPPGRLTKTLQPGGFELLAGLPIGTASTPKIKETPAPSRPADTRDKSQSPARAKAVAKAKEAVANALRAQRTAEQSAHRDEFESARATREAERAETRLTDARSALETAQDEFDAAEQNQAEAARKKDAAVRRARASADTLATARVRAEAAQAELERAESK